MNRKIISISTIKVEGYIPNIIAICDDGTLWRLTHEYKQNSHPLASASIIRSYWEPVKDIENIPQSVKKLQNNK